MKHQSIFFLSLFFSLSFPALAWDQHRTIMDALMDSDAAAARDYLKQTIKVPCLTDEQAMIHQIATELHINEAKVPLYSHEAHSEDCSKSVMVKVSDLVRSRFVDEPDFGMDQDLQNEADPTNDRMWMGGKIGPTSQGFRHMYFSGLKWSAPISTFQIPLRAVGQAPIRYDQIRNLSDRLFKEGKPFWGLRSLLWSIHFMQDLHQPFHTTQILDLRFIPIRTLFSGLVARTTQSVANYHYAYEGLMLEYVKNKDVSGFAKCLSLTGVASPVGTIYDVVEFSHSKASALGKNLFELLPEKLKSKTFSLSRAENPDSLDYYAMINAVDEKAELVRVFDVTCEIFQHQTELTWGELDRSFSK